MPLINFANLINVNCNKLILFQLKLVNSSLKMCHIKYISKYKFKTYNNGFCKIHFVNKFHRSKSSLASASTVIKEEIVTSSQASNVKKVTHGFEAPLVHYASKGILFVANESFMKKVPKKLEDTNEVKDSPQDLIHENDLINNTFLQLSNLSQKERDDLEYFEEIGREKLTVNPLIGEIPLNSLQWRSQKLDPTNLPKYYLDLAKSRLTGLVVLTAMAGYAIAPAPFEVSTFILCSLGTALVSCSANSVNQFFEVPFDSQMDRTKNRVLVRGLITPLHAVIFGLSTGFCGLSILYFGVNGLTAALGATNLLLYTAVYTPIKRRSILNTWIGALVGAIPPMMGWAGCCESLGVGAWIVGGILFAWQFPHFNSLSWNLRQDYSRAGYRMMCVTNPGLCRRTTLRYSAAIILVSAIAPLCNVTTWTFAIDSLPLNLYFTYLAWKFYKESDSSSSRKLFRFSLLHLPILLMLMIISKKQVHPKEDAPDPL